MQLQVVLQLAPSQLLLIGLSPLGQRLFTLTSTGNRINLEASVPALSRLDPERIVSDLELAYWPLPKLKKALPAAYRIEKTANTRLVWHAGHLLWLGIRAGNDRWQDPVTIYNLRAGYRLRVVPADTGVDSTTTE